MELTSSQDDDEVFSTQFSQLLKPIRELTKQHCWELNIAEKLDEYAHYVQDLHIEVNVNGEPMKLDFAKAAMVVQNSVQIYSKKVEYLWLLLQDVIEFLSSHGKTGDADEEGPSLTKKKNFRKRHHKNAADLSEPITLKFRKFASRIKKKAPVKQVKRVQILPYEILQLEEVVSGHNPTKIKLFTLSKEHLGYPSDLRSNFSFDPLSFFLRIHHSNLTADDCIEKNPEISESDNLPTDFPVNEASDLEFGCDVDAASSDDDQALPADVEDAHVTAEEPVERMELRQRNDPQPVFSSIYLHQLTFKLILEGVSSVLLLH